MIIHLRSSLVVAGALALTGCGNVYTALCEHVDSSDRREVVVEWTTLDVPLYGSMSDVEIDGQSLATGATGAAHVEASSDGFRTAGLQDFMRLEGEAKVPQRWTGVRINVLSLDETGHGVVYSWDADVGRVGSQAARDAWDGRYLIPPVPDDAQPILRCRLDEVL